MSVEVIAIGGYEEVGKNMDATQALDKGEVKLASKIRLVLDQRIDKLETAYVAIPS